MWESLQLLVPSSSLLFSYNHQGEPASIRVRPLALSGPFHRIARWNFLKREDELICSNRGQALKHRPKLLQHVCLLFRCMPASQNTIERGGRCFLSTSKPSPLSDTRGRPRAQSSSAPSSQK